ncbi:hypothetical protein C0991_007565 [Blastosporella zonata]|nr:hypothetical protein C0991_007565 [Blastosporella zonata]
MDSTPALQITAAERRQTRQLLASAEKPSEGRSPSSSEPAPAPSPPVSKTIGTASIPSPPGPATRTESTLKVKRKPTVITFVQSPDVSGNPASLPKTIHSIPSERVLVHSECEGPNRSFLSQLNPLRDKHPKLQHCASSPHLASPHLTSNPPLPVPTRKKSRPFCKDVGSPPSTPNRSVSCPIVKKSSIEKKKSQTLRTQPYEAPYFFPPPTEEPKRRRSTPSSRSIG